MHPTPEQALADRLDRIARLIEGQTAAQARSLVIIVQRWHAPALIQVLRGILHGITPEQALGWCGRLTRTMVRIGPAAMSRHGENAVCVPGLIGACLVRDDAVDRFVRPLPPFRGSVAQSGLTGLSWLSGLDGLDGLDWLSIGAGVSSAASAIHTSDALNAPNPRRCLWLDVTDDDLARSIVDISHVLAESTLLMDEPIDVALTIVGGPLPDAAGKKIIYRRAVTSPDRAVCAYRAIMWAP